MSSLTEKTQSKIRSLENKPLVYGDVTFGRMTETESFTQKIMLEVDYCNNIHFDPSLTDRSIQETFHQLSGYIEKHPARGHILEQMLSIYAYKSSLEAPETSLNEAVSFSHKCKNGWLKDFLNQFMGETPSIGGYKDQGLSFYKDELYRSVLGVYQMHTSHTPKATPSYLFWDLMDIITSDPNVHINNTDHKKPLLSALQSNKRWEDLFHKPCSKT